MVDFNVMQDIGLTEIAGRRMIYLVTVDPSVVATRAYASTLAIGAPDSAVAGQMWIKQTTGLDTNWVPFASAATFLGLLDTPSTYLGKAGERLQVNPAGTGVIFGRRNGLWYDIEPEDGYVLPVTQDRAYYCQVLYSPTPKYFDGSALRKYIAYYGGTGSNEAVAFSDDGVNWDNEAAVVGLQGNGYHCALVEVGSFIYHYYWDTTVSIYGPNAMRVARFAYATDCVNALNDTPCAGTYIHGGAVMDLRRGTYGPAAVFYNPAPTSNPLDPYTYPWCMIHNGSDGNNEGILFATSADGVTWAPWNGLNEVIPRGVAPAWDQWIGSFGYWIDDAGLWHCFYSGGLGTLAGEDTNFGGGIGYATSLDGITWIKHDRSPILRKSEAFKTWKRCYNPCVVRDANGYNLYYSAKNQASDYRTVRAKMFGHI